MPSASTIPIETVTSVAMSDAQSPAFPGSTDSGGNRTVSLSVARHTSISFCIAVVSVAIPPFYKHYDRNNEKYS